MVPRFVWVFVVFVIYTVAGDWTGASQYSPHQLFVHTKLLAGTLYRHRCGGAFLISAKRGRLGGYNLADWDNPSK